MDKGLGNPKPETMKNMHIHMYFVGQIHICFVKDDVSYVSDRCLMVFIS
jgi:hypothetical protein